MARWEMQAETCRDHGVPRSVCADPDKEWFPQRRVDYATMEREAAQAQYARVHAKRTWHDGSFKQWAEEPSSDFPYRYDMGVTIDVTETDENPKDDFLDLARRPGRVGAGEDEPEDAEPDERGEGEDGA